MVDGLCKQNTQAKPILIWKSLVNQAVGILLEPYANSNILESKNFNYSQLILMQIKILALVCRHTNRI